MKKLFSLALALVMIFALATTAMADLQITIDPNVPEGGVDTAETYTAYKIFDATYAMADGALQEGAEGYDANNKIAYTIDGNSPFFDTIKDFKVGDDAAFTLTPATGNNVGKYIVEPNSCYTSDAAALLSVELKKVITADPAPEGLAALATSSTYNQETEKFDINVSAKGYYVIVSSLGSKMIVDTLGDIEIDTKNEYPSLTKKIVDGDERVDAITADRGNIITFEVVVSVPATAVGPITVHDVLDDDMSYVGLADGTTVVTQTTTHCADCTVDFEISAATVAANLGENITFQYTATLNHDAEHDDAHTNTAWLTYSAFTSVEDVVSVKTYFIDVYKYTKDAADVKSGLAGAGFVLKNAGGKFYKNTNGDITWVDSIADATEYTTAADKNYTIKFEGLKDGTYTIVEKTVPTGYNPVAQDPTATISGANVTGTAQVEVLNQTGVELPSTGGVGTTIFTVVGALLMGAAFILFVTKKKMANEQ